MTRLHQLYLHFTSSAEERRRSERHPFQAELDIHTVDGQSFRGVARDLSGIGMGAVVSGGELREGDSIWVEYVHPALDGSQAVTRHAIVRRREGDDYAFEFPMAMDVFCEQCHALRAQAADPA